MRDHQQRRLYNGSDSRVTLAEQLGEDLKAAMKEKDKVRLSVLRMVKSAVRNAEIDGKRPLTDDEVLSVFRKEVKQRRETIATLEGSDRQDLVADAEAEIAILSSYLPAALSDEQVQGIIREVATEIGASSKADMGRLMPAVMKRVGASAEGRTVNRLVQQFLS
ncbi:MAG: GatB/YqeY domain-containing protein [Firmicutes bacterium]|nr:GatB/YqeY domain-containing protein [Bacillota bacterium]